MPSVYLFSNDITSIENFLNIFFQNKEYPNISLFDNYKLSFKNPTEICDIISAIIDNEDKYKISAWINLDEDLYIKVTNQNVNDIIKYLFERYPY